MGIEIGLIGCGGIGHHHAEALKKIPEAKMVAFGDVHLPAAEKMCKEYGGEYACADAERIIDDKRIKAVYICTRHDSHAALAIAAARAGKHIMIEKPLALSLDECNAVAAEVRKCGVKLMPAFKMRFYPLVQKTRAFIPNPQVIVGQMFDDRWADDHWAQDPKMGGANVHSQGCHTTDIIRHFSGSEPKKIWAVGGALTHPGHACIDQCVASIQFANGHVASWIQGDAATSPFTSKFFFEIFGDGKSVQLHDRLKKATFYDGKKTWTEERADEEGILLENKSFIEALLNNREPELSAHDGIQATRMVLAADRAIRTGQVQEL